MKKTMLFFTTLCLIFAVVSSAHADPVCTGTDYCDSNVLVGKQTGPIYQTGDHSWLFSADILFPTDVTYTDGFETLTDTEAKLTYACSSDGIVFSDCSMDEFTQAGTYTLKTEVAQNNELFYNGSSAFTTLSIIDPSQAAATTNGFVVIYHDTLSDTGSVPQDSKSYQPGASVIVLGNLGLNSEFQPDPLSRQGYTFTKWNTSPDQIGDSFGFGEIIRLGGNLDLYPQWEPIAGESLTESDPFAAVPNNITSTVQQQPQAAAAGTELEAKSWFNEGPPFNNGDTPLGSDPNIRWYPVNTNKPSWGNKPLPGTGFSTRHLTALREQPAALAYTTLGITLDLPTLNVQADVVSVPEEENGWSVDWLGEKTGLLEGSALPGEGISYIAGHNHLNTLETGPFLFLSQLEENDRIFVRGASGQLLEFSVFANERYAPDEFAAVHEKASEVFNALVLITCEDESIDGGYLGRRVVFARPL